MTDPIDYRDTVFLPKTDFPMKAGLPAKEPGILARWQSIGLYERLRDQRRGREKFILHDGPPYANGDMHIGHALNHILKDMVVRTQSLLGKDAPYVPGWDCHGLPIEWKVEEEYRKKKRNKDEVPVKEFRAECRAYAQNWVNVQREQLKRLGINGDWDNPYLTMDFAAEATIVTELMKFAESGQLYRGAKPVMWSPVEKTALAEAEVEYEDIVSTQIDVAFEIISSPIPELVGAHAVIWTTTPWTIPVNQAIAYGADIEYVVLNINGYRALVARLTWETLTGHSRHMFPSAAKIWQGTGHDLAGTFVQHPMARVFPDSDFYTRKRPMLDGSTFVTTDAGTGLVHLAPDHGEDDFNLCKTNNIEPVFAVEADGKYREDWDWLGGQGSVINSKFNSSDGPICISLREAEALLWPAAGSQPDYKHSYPHSWRSKAKVIYRCTPQWFVPMDKPLMGEPFDNFHGIFGGISLRTLATDAIASTRWIPEKGKNRIFSMVHQRPDWVLSRQRAWGVPITLFVDRKSGQYLCDAAVNARIIAAVRVRGVDAWSDEAAQGFLGDAHKLDDYERVTDILDVWFDSGCTHAFVLESGKWPDLVREGPADLYLEGSDQHRGWFQSSLLESCGTRGRAPYKAVLTHGFTMDQKGMKMSKSLGNTISPTDLMRDSGADILRLWALTVDFTEDHRIGKEILSGVSDQYRKLRNTFRYMLGALEGFSDAEKVPVADMPELERYVLHLLADMDAKLKTAVNDFDFNTYVRLITDFANNDLSAFFFDIRKDSLYCDAATSPKRMAYRTVLDILFHALVRYAAPVLVFTAEEVWQTRFPDDETSVHFLEWPEVPLARHPREGGDPSPGQEDGGNQEMDSRLRGNDEFEQKWVSLRKTRQTVTYAIEKLRRDGVVGSSNEAEIFHKGFASLGFENHDLAELFIVSCVTDSPMDFSLQNLASLDVSDLKDMHVNVTKTTRHKCGRCWRHLPEVIEDGALCGRCEAVVNG
jgi:isoleucyl-tRNA synthetase